MISDQCEGNVCDEKDQTVSEELTLAKNFTFKGILEIFHDIKSRKEKFWKFMKT